MEIDRKYWENKDYDISKGVYFATWYEIFFIMIKKLVKTFSYLGIVLTPGGCFQTLK